MTNFYDVAKWPIFSLLDEDILNSIKLACVFGSTGNEAIFVTTEDNVFAFGSNCNGCLGIGPGGGGGHSTILLYTRATKGFSNPP